MDIQKYFEYYSFIKDDGIQIKKFDLLSKETTLLKYFKQNKKSIINSINYAFFESKEPYILSVFSTANVKYIHINGRTTKEFPKSRFETIYEYENFLAIYGTIALLLDENFQITTFNDSRIVARELINDLTYKIYYDEDFNLNLENFLGGNNDEYLKYVYRYGYDFLLKAFFYLIKCEENVYEFERLKSYLKMDEKDLRNLFFAYKAKIYSEYFCK